MANDLNTAAKLRNIFTVKQNHALAVLIDETRRANNWSDQDVSDRATKSGYKLSKSNISRIRNSPVIALNIETVSALAEGLGVSKAVIAHAALASMGIVAFDSGQLMADAAIRRDPSLTAANKMHLLALLASMRDSQTGANASTKMTPKEAADHATHMSQAGDAPAKPQGKKVPYVDPHAHPDADSAGNVPLPANYYELAANDTRNYGAEEDQRTRERGEETQDTRELD